MLVGKDMITSLLIVLVGKIRYITDQIQYNLGYLELKVSSLETHSTFISIYHGLMSKRSLSRTLCDFHWLKLNLFILN